MSSIKSLTRFAAIGLAVAVGLLAMAQKPALAQSGTWTATSGGSWSTTGNWNTVANGADNTAVFTTAIPAFTARSVTLNGNRTIGYLRLGGTSSSGYYSLDMGTSGTLTLSTTLTGSIPGIDVANNRTGVITASLAGNQGFQKTSNGTLYLSGNSTYTGTTSVIAGTLELQSPNAFGATGAGNETVVASGARVRIGGTTSTAESFIISGDGVSNTGAVNFGSSGGGVNTSGTITSQVTLAANASVGAATNSTGVIDRGGAGNAVDNAGFVFSYIGGGNLTVNNPIVGSGAFTVNGSGIVYLTAANTYSGTTGWTTANGTLSLGNGGTGGSLSTSSAITLSNASAKLAINQSDTVTQGVDFSGSAIIGVGQFLQNGSGTTILTAANSFTGATAVNAGILQLGNAGTTGGLSGSSAISIASGARLFVNRTNTATQGTDFSTAAITGDGGFTQAGSGTTILNAANSYGGTTNVDAGTLRINGNQSGATGAVTVAAGATLGGSGTTGGAVSVDGTLSPGNSPGVLTVASVVLGASSTSFFEINGTTRGTDYDGLDITADSGLTYGGALSLSFGNVSAFATNTTFDLFSFTGTPSGNFSSVTSTGFYAGTWTLASGVWSLTTNEQKLSFTPSTGDIVVAVPEPSTIVLLSGLAVVGFFARRRRA